MKVPKVDLVVCGRFHYHKFLHILYQKGALNKFIYSYKLNYNLGVPPAYLKNLFLKEYLMYFGAKFLKGPKFFKYVAFLHKIWQIQASALQSTPNLVHFLIHGNSDMIVRKYKQIGIPIIGEVVNAHPVIQEQILIREYDTHGAKYEPGEKSFKEKILREFELCDFLLAPSSYIKRSLIDGGIKPEKIKVLPYGTEAVSLRKSAVKISEGDLIKLICVSQLTYRKGTIYLLKAVESLIQQGYACELTLVGKLDPSYAAVVSEYLSKPYIKHISHIANNLIHQTMIEQDLLVMPSLEDGFGIVVSEAISVHLPVVVTKNCGSAEIIQDGVNGWVVEPFSEPELIEGIKKSIGYQFDFSAKVPDWDDYASGLLKIYSEIA